MAAKLDIRIDVVSDVVCPWCYVGSKRLQQALAGLPNVVAEVQWRPFQLDPTIPAEGMDRKTYMRNKFGNDDARLKAMHDRLIESTRDAGIPFAFDRIKVAANTLDAHRLIRWAGGQGAAVQDKVVRALFKANFEDGRNIGDHAVLTEIAGECGMDVAVVSALLPTDADREEVRQEIAQAQRMGVTGVPCFLLENKYAVMGAQPTEALADAIRQVAEAKAAGKLDAA
ncbi:MAG: DsbA family protein [Rhizobiaceae bacterium]|nr:DsbA family protein [Rhizobiaceae bacterium]